MSSLYYIPHILRFRNARVSKLMYHPPLDGDIRQKTLRSHDTLDTFRAARDFSTVPKFFLHYKHLLVLHGLPPLPLFLCTLGINYTCSECCQAGFFACTTPPFCMTYITTMRGELTPQVVSHKCKCELVNECG